VKAHAREAADRRVGAALMAAALAAALVPAPGEAAAEPVRAEAGIVVAAPGQVRVAARGRVAVRFFPRPIFYPYYYPYCPHQYWEFLYGAPLPTRHGCGVGMEVVAAQSPRPPRLGLGVFGGSVAVREDDAAGEVGVIGRLRVWDFLQIELELARSELDDEAGSDNRIGGALLLQMAPYSAVSPYLLGGGGFGRAELDDGDLTADRPYGEVGVGLEWALARHLSLFGDVRLGLRKLDGDDQEPVLRARTAVAEDVGDDDDRFARARIGGLLYF
jgi:Outer membrane protein beta-barrel domain